jgi:sulfur carrier protein ThiS
MKIELEYAAMLHVKGPASGSLMEVDHGVTITDLLTQLGIPSHHRGSVTAFVNNVRASRTKVLNEKDRVFLSVPMSGG